MRDGLVWIALVGLSLGLSGCAAHEGASRVSAEAAPGPAPLRAPLEAEDSSRAPNRAVAHAAHAASARTQPKLAPQPRPIPTIRMRGHVSRVPQTPTRPLPAAHHQQQSPQQPPQPPTQHLAPSPLPQPASEEVPSLSVDLSGLPTVVVDGEEVILADAHVAPAFVGFDATAPGPNAPNAPTNAPTVGPAPGSADLAELFAQEEVLPAGPVACGALALLIAGGALLLSAPRGLHRSEPFPGLLAPYETQRVLSASNLRRATLRGAAGAAVLTSTYVCASLLFAVAGLGGSVDPWGLVLTCALGLSFAPAAMPELWAERREPSRRLDLVASLAAGLVALVACVVALLQVIFVAERAQGADFAQSLSTVQSLGSVGLVGLLFASLPVATIASLLCYQRLRHATCTERTPLDRVHDLVLGLSPVALLGLVSIAVVALSYPMALTASLLRQLASQLALLGVVGLSTLMALSCAAAGADRVERNLLVQARESAR